MGSGSSGTPPAAANGAPAAPPGDVSSDDVKKYGLDKVGFGDVKEGQTAPASKVVSAMSILLDVSQSRLHERARAAIARDRRSGKNMALAMIDLGIGERGSCLKTCTSGEHPDVNAKCH